MYASSFWTRYRNGLGPLFLSLTKPQIVSIDLPSAFFLAARSIPSNSTESGSLISAAIVAFAFFITDSSSSCEGGGISVFAASSCGISVFVATVGVVATMLDLSSGRTNDAAFIFSALWAFAILVELL